MKCQASIHNHLAHSQEAEPSRVSRIKELISGNVPWAWAIFRLIPRAASTAASLFWTSLLFSSTFWLWEAISTPLMTIAKIIAYLCSEASSVLGYLLILAARTRRIKSYISPIATAWETCRVYPILSNIMDKSNMPKKQAMVMSKYQHYLNPIMGTFISSLVLPSVLSFLIPASWFFWRFFFL